MYNKEEKNVYYLHKLLIALMFDDNHESYKDAPWLYDINVLEIFGILISKFVEKGFLSSEVKNNLYDIVIFLREMEDENYEKRVEILNKITMLLNSQKEDNSLIYYYNQLLVRTKKYKQLKKYTAEDIEREIPFVNESIYGDSLIMLSHYKDTSEENFKNIYLSDFTNNGYYYQSLNVILKECPSMFEDEVFRSRVKMVLDNNKKIKKYFKDTHKEVKKLIKVK